MDTWFGMVKLLNFRLILQFQSTQQIYQDIGNNRKAPFTNKDYLSAALSPCRSSELLLQYAPGEQNVNISLIAKVMGATWGQPRADRTQVGPMLALWTLLSRYLTHRGWVIFPSERIHHCTKSAQSLPESKYNNLPSRNYNWKCRLQQSGHLSWPQWVNLSRLCVSVDSDIIEARPLSDPNLTYC